MAEATTTSKKIKWDLKCQVCGDESFSVNYGAVSCEGCKAFFKRSITRNDELRCFLGNNCQITKDTRINCKACRLRKCLEVGMFIKGVQIKTIKEQVDKALEMNRLKKGEENNPMINLFESNTISVTRRINNNSFNIEMLVDQLNSICFSVNSSFKQNRQNMKMIACLNTINQPNDNDVQIEDVLEGFIGAVKIDTENIFTLFRNMPELRLNNYYQSSFLIRDLCLNVYFGLFNSFYCDIEDQLYNPLPNKTTLSLDWIEKICGSETRYSYSDFLKKLNKLNLKDSERSVLFPFIITKYIQNFNDEFKALHLHYARALYEVLIVRNRRNMDFIKDLVEVIELIQKLNNLYDKNLRPALPIET